MAKTKSFIKRHLKGIVLSSMTLAIGIIISSLYDIFRSPVEAQVATKQVEDSSSRWALYHSMAYGNLVPTIIVVGTIILIFIFLIPTIKEVYNIITNN